VPLKEPSLEYFVPLSCDRQLALEIIVSMQALQEWIGHDIRIGKEPALDARA
jgi:hypothetical protein